MLRQWTPDYRPDRDAVLHGVHWQSLPLEWGETSEYCIGRSLGSPGGARLRKGSLGGADGWDLPAEWDAARAQWDVTCDALRRHRLPVRTSAAMTAGIASAGLSSGPLPLRLAPMARCALAQGPQLIAKASALWAREWDMRQAYLAALDRPVPVPGSWRVIREPTWGSIMHLEGMATAHVEVPLSAEWELGPLPVRTPGASSHGAQWPTGLVCGTWPIHWLRSAAALGCDVLHVWDALSCKTAPLLRPLFDRLSAIDDKHTRRALYTRAWGRYASEGHWRGWFEDRDEKLTSNADIAEVGKRQWKWAYHDADLTRADYRPDWSAWVSSRCAIAVVEACATLPPGSLVATHVDSMIVEARDWQPPEPELWKVKREGLIRCYAVGTWVHDWHATAQGQQGATPESLNARAAQGAIWAGSTMDTRQWTKRPMKWPEATSKPNHLNMETSTVSMSDGECAEVTLAI